jgi:hypothetical protein
MAAFTADSVVGARKKKYRTRAVFFGSFFRHLLFYNKIR